MTARKALWIAGSGGTPSYDAIDDRSQLGALLAGDFFDTVTAGTGMRGRAHGVLSGDALAVTSSGSNDRSVVVAAGMAAVRGTHSGQLGCYLCANDDDETIQLQVRSSTQARRDLIIAEVRDSTYDGANNDWQLRAVQGTSGSGTDPTVPASALVLARITIPPGSNPYTVSADWITDLRPQARAIGGILPVSTAADHPDPQDYDVVWEHSTSILKMRLDGAWHEIARDYDANWSSVTPSWAGSFTVGVGENAGPQYLRYVQYGSTVAGVAGFERGDASSQSGNLVLDLVASGLPPVKAPGDTAGASHMAGGRAWDSSANRFWSLTASVSPSTGRIQNFGTAGDPVWSATTPFTWATGDTLRIFFNYEADL